MKKVLLLIGPAMMLFASCGNQTTAENTSAKKDSTATFDIAAVKSAIADANKAFGDAVVKGDSVAIADLYTSDANMLPPNMPKAENHQAILGMAGGLARMGIKSFSLESTDVYGDPDMVVEEGKYTVGDAKGKALDEGKYIVLWKQENGKWKLYRDIWNSNMPATASK
jgi:ketosteroid isomerase-like protein